jgi:hypothetical protein
MAHGGRDPGGFPDRVAKFSRASQSRSPKLAEENFSGDFGGNGFRQQRSSTTRRGDNLSVEFAGVPSG